MNIFDSIYEATGISYIMESMRKKVETFLKPKYTPEQITPKKYLFRPQTLEQYVGQERAKTLIGFNIQKIQTMKPVHFIISGTRGHGKSTLAYIIANILGYPIDTYVGGSFTMNNLSDFLKSNEVSNTPRILFIDETHGLPKELGEFMYPLLEDFLIPVGNITVKPFIFIGATTEKNILLKKFAPLVDRCGCDCNLSHYTSDNIKTILKQVNYQLYKKNISEEVYDILSNNTRFNPRTSIALFEDLLVCGNVQKVLEAHRIVKNSLTTDDILILKHLSEIDKPVGIETLAIIIQQTKQDYMSIVEPFLLQNFYLSRTARGRVITEKGKELLRNLNENH
jgi:Holliday junction DNA helicase RuvB